MNNLLENGVLKINGAEIGFIGEIHPASCENYEIKAKVYAAVLDIETLFGNAVTERKYAPLPKYPATKRDIAVVVGEETTAAEIEGCVKNAGGKLLESIALFDVYTGAGMENGKKSMAYSITFRAADKTLSDEDINGVMEKILKELKEKTGAELRR